MSGKPATPAESRAGVPGAPRLLVYVADPRQLEPGGAAPDPPPEHATPSQDTLYLNDHLPNHITLPKSTVYKTQIDQNDLRDNHNNAIFYQPISDNSRYCAYGPNNAPTQYQELYSGQQQFKRNVCLNDDKLSEQTSVKTDHTNSLVTDIGRTENYLSIDAGDSPKYQTACPCPISSDSTMPTVQPLLLHHGQYSESVHNTEGKNCSDSELSVDKYVNYQFLEQSVSHRSVVNQSISILNQQVGVNRGTVSESDSRTVSQLVRTADGVVLAVVPSTILTHPTETDLNSRSVQSEFLQTVTVPLGWRRIISNTSVVYISPSGAAISTLPQLRDYLQTTGTCKCGLPCPLRPETAFSFDSKVGSKPYQASSYAELTKLCNHKRKLLASVHAHSSTATPPPPPPLPPPPPPHADHKKGAEVTVLKKKMKKRAGFASNMSVSQLMVQRERPPSEFKSQDIDPNRTISPSSRTAQNTNMQNCPPGFPQMQQQHAANSIAQDNDVKQDAYVQKSSHYLTVNSGWITQQQQNLDTGQKQSHPTGQANNQLNMGLPVLGTNGQIIGVNTGYNKQTTNYKNLMSISHNAIEQQIKEEAKHNIAAQHNVAMKQTLKEEESQIFCGLNQPLTPEVMQKINEQQQLFIQQNQKQIEMAMKGFKSQLSETQGKSNGQGQYASQGQLFIQNGTVVKTNPAKTPPWQVKKNDIPNPMVSPTQKTHKLETIDFDESNLSITEESSGSSCSFPSVQPVCSRVPPLPQHYNIMGQQWPPIEVTKKKVKGSGAKAGKKKSNTTETKLMTYGNNGMRTSQDSKDKACDEMSNKNVPSFMDDPNGYLAQQTVLLNNTISRQVNASYDVGHFESSSNGYGSQKQIEKSYKTTGVANTYRGNVVSNPLQSPSTPDSSVLSDKSLEHSMSHCCRGCSNAKCNGHEFHENQMRPKYIKQNSYKVELDGRMTVSPRRAFDENPVSSSTFSERNHTMMHESCGPIQAGTVSTSNVPSSESLQPPEPSPTPSGSGSSRGADTPLGGGSRPQLDSPAPCRDRCHADPPPPGDQLHRYSSPDPNAPPALPAPPANHLATGTQMMHFISNHNVNKNLMEVDNISMVGVRPGMKTQRELIKSEGQRRLDNSMPGYCPPPHLGGGPAHSLMQSCYVQTYVTTMASGFSVTRNTVTSVLAGKANTATTSINASQANFVRPSPPPSVNMATTYAIPNNQPDPFLNSVNLPTSYPLHIAGTTAQNMITKTPLEMVQNVIGGPPKSDANNSSLQHVRRPCQPTTPGQILISSTGQIIVSNNQMPPPPPKATITPAQASGSGTNVTTSATQAAPALGAVPSMVSPPAVVVNTLPAPFVIQPPMMAVDGPVVQQNTVIPQIVTGNIVPGQTPNDNTRQVDLKNNQSFVQGVAMLSPESLKKRNKKKKGQTANITNVLHITAPQQNPNNIMVHHTSPQHSSSPQFSPRGYQLSPNSNISPAPMLQALTIVPGKSGTPAHIVMNGQGNSNNFGSQQIIANTSPSQQINLLQPVNLINNGSGVMPNFQAFQQFIVPNLGGMVMTADGTALIQDNSTGMPMQLQLQTVNGQNVLTPVQNPGMFTGANSGVVIRAQNQQGKILQSQHSPGAQFLSPNSQVMMSSPNFNGQLSPLLANLSPTNVTFNTSPHQVRSSNVQAQEFIQTNQMGQTVMVPLSPKQVSIASATTNRNGSTLVQQNTTIVQQQTTLVSNSQNVSAVAANLQGGNSSRLSIDPNSLLAHRPKGRSFVELPPESGQAEEPKEEKQPFELENDGKARGADGYAKFANELSPLMGGGVLGSHVRHSVSTQTLVNQQRGGGGGGGGGKSPCSHASGGSPPDTTTHSPLGALEAAASPRLYSARCVSTQGNYADTTTKSPEPSDTNSSAMVQCVSSSEQDMAEAHESAWPRADDADPHNMISNMQVMRQGRVHNPVESTEINYNHGIMNPSAGHQQSTMPVAPPYYERTHAYKRKNEFADGPAYRPDKMLRTGSRPAARGPPREADYDAGAGAGAGAGAAVDKLNLRHLPSPGAGADATSMHRVQERHNLGPGNDTKKMEDECKSERAPEDKCRKFEVGDLVWGPVKGYASWPGKLVGASVGVGAGGARWAVRWFGADKAPGCVEGARLLTLSEGLEAHHAARTKHRKSRKLNTLLENAIQEAMSELDKKCEMRAAEPRAGASGGGEGARGPSPAGASASAPASPEVPRRSAKRDRHKHHRKNTNKPRKTHQSKSTDNRLRSSR